MSATHRPGRVQNLARLVALILSIAMALPTLPFQPLPATATSGAATGDSAGPDDRAAAATGPVAAGVLRGHTGERTFQG